MAMNLEDDILMSSVMDKGPGITCLSKPMLVVATVVGVMTAGGFSIVSDPFRGKSAVFTTADQGRSLLHKNQDVLGHFDEKNKRKACAAAGCPSQGNRFSSCSYKDYTVERGYICRKGGCLPGLQFAPNGYSKLGVCRCKSRFQAWVTEGLPKKESWWIFRGKAVCKKISVQSWTFTMNTARVAQVKVYDDTAGVESSRASVTGSRWMTASTKFRTRQSQNDGLRMYSCHAKDGAGKDAGAVLDIANARFTYLEASDTVFSLTVVARHSYGAVVPGSTSSQIGWYKLAETLTPTKFSMEHLQESPDMWNVAESAASRDSRLEEGGSLTLGEGVTCSHNSGYRALEMPEIEVHFVEAVDGVPALSHVFKLESSTQDVGLKIKTGTGYSQKMKVDSTFLIYLSFRSGDGAHEATSLSSAVLVQNANIPVEINLSNMFP